MATLERRVQILFDPAVYAALEAEAEVERQSVAAILRDTTVGVYSLGEESPQRAASRALLSRIASTDRAFDSIPGLTRLDPADLG